MLAQLWKNGQCCKTLESVKQYSLLRRQFGQIYQNSKCIYTLRVAITLLRISPTEILIHVHETYIYKPIHYSIACNSPLPPSKGNKLMYINREMVK